MKLAKEIYLATDEFPSEEKFGITSQMRRSAVSIPSNIAEGCGRQTRPDFLRFLNIALGSAFELETQYLLAVDLEYIPAVRRLEEQISEVQRMIYGLLKQSN